VTVCTAVGSRTSSTANGTFGAMLAELWNGSSWSIQSTPNPIGYSAAASTIPLSGVACASATACTAAGYFDGSVPVGISGVGTSTEVPFAERYS
jgi:hypothetical protein